MANHDVYLSYYQVMSLMYAIDEFRKNNQYFSDGIAEKFQNYVVDRTFEISMYPSIILKIKPSLSKYMLSQSMVEYLIRLTGVNIFDKDTLEKYTVLVKEFEHNLEKESLSKLSDSSSPKK